MSTFIKTRNGSYVGTSEIVSVHNLDAWACTITTRNGESYPVDNCSSNVADLIDRDNSLIIPASPGYSVIRAVPPEKEGKWQYELFPVVGWQKLPSDDCIEVRRPIYDALARSTPIVAGYVKEQTCWNPLLPDGRVIDRMHYVRNNIQEWFEDGMLYRTGSNK
jgi:hypothetical protein